MMTTKVKKWTLLLAVGFAAGCSGNDDNNTSNALCQQMQDKNTTCQISGAVNCSSLSSQSQVLQDAMSACLVPLDCTAWKAYVENYWMDNATMTCFSDHNVGFTGVFTCADGNGSVPEQVKCDGKSNCPDGSDEVGC
jgi:hypothetical protein